MEVSKDDTDVSAGHFSGQPLGHIEIPVAEVTDLVTSPCLEVTDRDSDHKLKS